MNYEELIDAHRQQKADITIAAQPVDIETATQMGIFRFDREGTIVAFEEKPKEPRLREIGRSIPEGATFATPTSGRSWRQWVCTCFLDASSSTCSSAKQDTISDVS